METQERTLTVGRLAKRTGLTVRTLHHYDAIGLLPPAERTRAGYRVYGEADVARLNRIVALRQLGMSLEEIGRCLDDASYTLPVVLRMRAERLRTEIEEQRRLCVRLERLAERLDGEAAVSVDEFLETIGALTMIEKYYTPEQLRQLERRASQVGEARIREVEAEWPELMARMRAAQRDGLDPASPEVRPLALRWRALVAEFTGGDPGIARSLGRMYESEPAARERAGLDAALFEYAGRAVKALPPE